jgi:hypothetical protein
MTVPTTVTFGELGPLVTSVDVDNLILGLLKPWIPFHQRWLESERGLAPGFLADPRTYSSVLDDVEFPDAALPALYVTAAETIGRPAMNLEHQWNNAFDGEIRWLSTNVAPVSDRSGAGRYLSAGIADYAVYADHAVGCDIPTATLPTGSPYPPPTDPYAPLEPLVPVSTVTTEVRPK